jgi:inosine-uridine nucleoside N-ribohydrolase
MAVKLLLDTDIGSDIDDAVCLAYLLAQPACELLGITTVSGDPVKRAMLASAQCKVAGKQVPIFPGAGDPLLIAQRQPHVPQADALERWPHDSSVSFEQGEAIEFLRQTIRKHPGEVVLLTIGPLTNIALLFRSDPSIPALLKGLVMMGGSFSGRPGVGAREWNIILDPHAADIVYRTPVAIHRSIGLDVTLRVTMPADEVRQRFQVPLLRPVLDFAESWFQRQTSITFHDPLAAATLFDEHICTTEHGTVQVELADEKSLGKTVWMPGGPEQPHQVAFDVDVDRFFKHYFAVVEAGSTG